MKNVSLKIPAGSFAAFVGQSGSGKTTAMSLIENFYTPSSGIVTVDGLRTDRTPIKSYDGILRLYLKNPSFSMVRFDSTYSSACDLICTLPSSASATSRRGSLSAIEQEEREEENALLAPYKEDTAWQDTIDDSIVIAACQAAGIHDTIYPSRKATIPSFPPPNFPVVKSNVCPSHVRSSANHVSFCSTKVQVPWTVRVNKPSKRRSAI